MAKLQSSLTNMLLSLTIISLVAAGLLAGVYTLTAAQIEAQNEAAKVAAQTRVLNGEEGVAIEAEANGFGGKIRIIVGFAADGRVLGYEVLEQQETPGLGTKMVDWFKNADKAGQNIVGRTANGKFTVSKDGGEVDAITAATISSRAFLSAVNAAYTTFMAEQNVEVEACSGASIVNEDENENANVNEEMEAGNE